MITDLISIDNFIEDLLKEPSYSEKKYGDFIFKKTDNLLKIKLPYYSQEFYNIMKQNYVSRWDSINKEWGTPTNKIESIKKVLNEIYPLYEKQYYLNIEKNKLKKEAEKLLESGEFPFYFEGNNFKYEIINGEEIKFFSQYGSKENNFLMKEIPREHYTWNKEEKCRIIPLEYSWALKKLIDWETSISNETLQKRETIYRNNKINPIKFKDTDTFLQLNIDFDEQQKVFIITSKHHSYYELHIEPILIQDIPYEEIKFRHDIYSKFKPLTDKKDVCLIISVEFHKELENSLPSLLEKLKELPKETKKIKPKTSFHGKNHSFLIDDSNNINYVLSSRYSNKTNELSITGFEIKKELIEKTFGWVNEKNKIQTSNEIQYSNYRTLILANNITEEYAIKILKYQEINNLLTEAPIKEKNKFSI